MNPMCRWKLTASTRAGFHRYVFPKRAKREVILELDHRDKVTEGLLRRVSETEFEGYRHSTAWATDQRLFYVIQFSEPVQHLEQNAYFDPALSSRINEPTDIPFTAAFEFGYGDKPLLVKVGISSVDIDGARKNLEEEIPHWEFDQTQEETEALWEEQLAKIKVESSDLDKKITFYSALYHCMVAPNTFSDVDGRYRGMDMNIHPCDSGRTQYTVFSLWDTYRTLHPLFTIIDQKRTNDFIHTFLNQYQQGGRLPMWELAGNYTGCMIGYHAVPVITDAYVKGIDDYDCKLAIQAMLESAKADRLGIREYGATGFLPAEVEAESVSKTLEYAYDDWCIAQMARKMGNESLAIRFAQRGLNYQNVLDPETGFMRARQNNQWFYPFDPAEVNFNYTEANAWQYSFAVPHDIEGLAKRMGGKTALEAKLDQLFSASSQTTGRDQADITGLIGQYAHGNEPSHHMAYLYNYVGAPHKTQQYVRQIMDELYTNAPDGLSGNEDCGQMSAWLVMSALGFYPVTPGEAHYAIGSPWFERASIQLENDRSFTILREGTEWQTYVADAELRGTRNQRRINRSYLSHKEIMEGGEFRFKMSNEPAVDKEWTRMPSPSVVRTPISAVPAVSRGEKSFKESTVVELNCAYPDARIYYSLNGGNARLYKEPLTLTETTVLTTWSEANGAKKSPAAISHFRRINSSWSISLETEYGNHYSAGGDGALIDQIRGGKDFRTGSWQGV